MRPTNADYVFSSENTILCKVERDGKKGGGGHKSDGGDDWKRFPLPSQIQKMETTLKIPLSLSLQDRSLRKPIRRDDSI